MSGGLLFSMSFFLFIWLEVRTHSLSKNFIEWSWWPGMGHTSKRVKLPVSHKKAEYARGCILIFTIVIIRDTNCTFLPVPDVYWLLATPGPTVTCGQFYISHIRYPPPSSVGLTASGHYVLPLQNQWHCPPRDRFGTSACTLGQVWTNQ